MGAAAPDHLFRAGPRRALPRTCRPAPDETTGSYLLRLAAANRVTGPDLIGYLTAGMSQSIAKVTLAALAAASGQPPVVLAYALPELRAQYPGQHSLALQGRTLPAKPNTVRPACRRCAAVRTAAERIDMWYRHEHTVCLRHLLWTGPGAGHPRDQVDLAAHPDIVHAQVRHRRLIREHGHGIVRTAYHTAREIWETLIYRGWGVPCALARDTRLRGQSSFGHQDCPRDPAHHAVAYPEAVTLTGLLASPHWRPFATSASAADRDRFRAEFQRRLPPTRRVLANTDLHIWWHQPTVEVVPYSARPASPSSRESPRKATFP